MKCQISCDGDVQRLQNALDAKFQPMAAEEVLALYLSQSPALATRRDALQTGAAASFTTEGLKDLLADASDTLMGFTPIRPEAAAGAWHKGQHAPGKKGHGITEIVEAHYMKDDAEHTKEMESAYANNATISPANPSRRPPRARMRSSAP